MIRAFSRATVRAISGLKKPCPQSIAGHESRVELHHFTGLPGGAYLEPIEGPDKQSRRSAPEAPTAYGGTLLFVYGIGIAIPVVVLGASAAKLAARLEKNGGRVWVDRATGALLVAMGLYVIWSA
jgi:hypothetical protein